MPESGCANQRTQSPEFYVILVCALALTGCTAATPTLQPTTEYVPVSSIRSARGGSQAYDLSIRERLVKEKRAAEGDIAAAKALVEYHEMVTKDEREYQRWRALVALLQKAQGSAARLKKLSD